MVLLPLSINYTPLAAGFGVYFLVCNYLNENSIGAYRSYRSILLKRIAYVAATVFCLWMMDPRDLWIFSAIVMPYIVAYSVQFNLTSLSFEDHRAQMQKPSDQFLLFLSQAWQLPYAIKRQPNPLLLKFL